MPALIARTLTVACLLWLTAFDDGSVQAAHPISVTEAQVYVTRSAARVRITLFAEDLYLFQELEPDDHDRIPPDELQRGLREHREFLLEKVSLRDVRGERCAGRITDVQPFEIPDEGIAIDDLMLHTATYEIEYPFEEPPEFLTIQQDISDANFIFPSEMKLLLHQAESELTYAESLKPGAAETIRFDWSGQPLSEDATDADWDAWFERQREQTLGITSFSSVYSFIYVEPAEVRHEVLIPLASLKTMIALEHADPAFLEVEEQDAVREEIRQWLADGNPAEINDDVVKPEFSRIDFYGLDLRDFARQADQQRVSLTNGRVGIIMTYRPSADVVRDVMLSWDTFNSSLRKIRSVVFTYPDGISKFEFSRFKSDADNMFRWTVDPDNLPTPVREVPADVPPKPVVHVPVLSALFLMLVVPCLLVARLRRVTFLVLLVVAAGVAAPFAWMEFPHPWKPVPELQAEESQAVFESLLNGTYRALDFGTKEQVYDSLSTFVDGQLLEQLYLQLRESLRIKEQGGAVARVKEVEAGTGETIAAGADPVEWPGYAYQAEWTVSGTVEHWGHIHERTNRFAAVFRIRPVDGAWKIVSMDVQDQENVATKTRLRQF